MAIIMQKPDTDKEMSIMSDGHKYWLVFTIAGEWFTWTKITPQQATSLNKKFNIDLDVDEGMSDPDA